MLYQYTPLITIIDTGAIHLIISTKCVLRLKLEVFSMNGSMIIDTLASGSETTSSMYLNCPVIIFGRDFGMDVVYLSLSQLDVILGMNWLEFNHVLSIVLISRCRFLIS